MYINTLDPEIAYNQINELFKSTRNNSEACFIEIECYRFLGHARMDKSPYRDVEEELKGRNKDPIIYTRKKIISKNLLNEIDLNKIDNQISIEMDKAVQFAIKSPSNNYSELHTDVFEENSNKPESVENKINKILNI